MIDFRYHLASIVAIFFALALGMLIGAQLANEGTLMEEHARLIEQIEEAVARVRTENRRLHEQLAYAQDRLAAERNFVDEMMASLLGDRLNGVRIDVVTNERAHFYSARVVQTLQRSGADVLVRDKQAKSHDDKDDVNVLTLVLWGDGEVPDDAKVVAAEERADASVQRAKEQPIKTVWGWPGAVEKDLPNAVFVEALDTSQGLFTLIDVLRGEAKGSWAEDDATGS